MLFLSIYLVALGWLVLFLTIHRAVRELIERTKELQNDLLVVAQTIEALKKRGLV